MGAEHRKSWIERPLGPLQAHLEGFDLHARVAIATDQAGGVGRLEKLVRYCARPPLAHDRLSLQPDGCVLLALKTPWSDGTTHLACEPLDFLAKLSAMILRPHKNLVLYTGVRAARARLQSSGLAHNLHHPGVLFHADDLHRDGETVRTGLPIYGAVDAVRVFSQQWR